MSRESHRPPTGFRRRPRVADLMTPELLAFVERSATAERAGDAEEALAYHLGVPMFAQSRHRSMLEQLVAASGELTPWVWARWIVYQAVRTEDSTTQTGRLVRQAGRDAVDSFHTDLLNTAYDEGGDPVKVMARVLGESWAFHQLAAHEYGVLAAFLDELAAGELASQAELARSWVGAPMGGYRVEGRGGACALVVRDLRTDDAVDVLDLGAGGLTGPEGCVIGRLVPSGTTPELMFDLAPMPVDEPSARQVSECSGDGWADALMVAIEDGRLDGGDLLREDYELMSDVLSLRLLEFGTRPADLPWVMSRLLEGRHEVGRAAVRILRSASTMAIADADAPYVAGAVLDVHAYAEARRTVLAPGQRDRWLRWAELTPDPARSRLLRFADLTAAVA
jgi:hypothetical protein